jgi:hypothetical protein
MRLIAGDDGAAKHEHRHPAPPDSPRIVEYDHRWCWKTDWPGRFVKEFPVFGVTVPVRVAPTGGNATGRVTGDAVDIPAEECSPTANG